MTINDDYYDRKIYIAAIEITKENEKNTYWTDKIYK